jgi:hypothetical protein
MNDQPRYIGAVPCGGCGRSGWIITGPALKTLNDFLKYATRSIGRNWKLKKLKVLAFFIMFLSMVGCSTPASTGTGAGEVGVAGKAQTSMGVSKINNGNIKASGQGEVGAKAEAEASYIDTSTE